MLAASSRAHIAPAGRLGSGPAPGPRSRTWPRWITGIFTIVMLAGCEQRMRDMYEQPRYDPGESSTLWPDGKAGRPPVAGTVAWAAGDLAATSSGRRGTDIPRDVDRAEQAAALPPLTPALLARGRERYGIYCLPCHGAVGDGDGPVVRRGFPRPPSYHQERLRTAPDRHFYDVISQGFGVMKPYADRVTPQDRWAITAYVRALQLSQHAPFDRLPPRLQARIGVASAPEGGS